MTDTLDAAIVVVGGGIAGAAVGARLARRGHDVLLVERTPGWRWRAGGVFASPAAVAELRALGLGRADLERIAQPIPAMRVETPDGTMFRLTYGADDPGDGTAVGLDRSALDPLLLERAVAAGARLERGATVTTIVRAGTGIRLGITGPLGERTVRCRLVVGADGPRSLVARWAGAVQRPWLDRIGLTFHRSDGAGDRVRDARMVALPGAYCGIAPVPGGRVNVGIVLASRGWKEALAAEGPSAVADRVLQAVPHAAVDVEGWRGGGLTDRIAGAAPLGTRVRRRAGGDWLLVGDAAGFLDPFTGEGLHRALVSARLAASAIDLHVGGRRDTAGLRAYDRAMRARFRSKDAVSLLVQGFLARPHLFAYAARRLATRPTVRATMGLVMGDLVPASRALDPRFVAMLLAP